MLSSSHLRLQSAPFTSRSLHSAVALFGSLLSTLQYSTSLPEPLSGHAPRGGLLRSMESQATAHSGVIVRPWGEAVNPWTAGSHGNTISVTIDTTALYLPRYLQVTGLHCLIYIYICVVRFPIITRGVGLLSLVSTLHYCTLLWACWETPCKILAILMPCLFI